ncbi:MAG: ribose-phosphate pyrophosphokinase [Anaerolineae bacterium]|nr:ribose-phosphate pyrophosphokinase [Caldilineales bacterium]MCX7852343.1 ribose-phosphate pyrophosphokinase [Caldilineales bacterium]MDW8268260.1 ribose-phosphate pyrophosphokinase [Anaerolineae bacterium]
MSVGLYGDLAVVSGTCHPELAAAVCEYLRVNPTPMMVKKFPNENIFVRLEQSVRAMDVFLIQPLGSPVNDMVMELLITLDAIRRDSAGRITAVVPYYAYGRTDKKDQPRVPITARLLADLITVAGAERFLTIDLHAGQIQGFFTIPNDELTARYLLVDYLRSHNLHRNAVIVSPDIGGVRRARNFAEDLNIPLAIIEKRRTPDGERTEFYNLIGQVEGRTCIMVDDEIDTGGTLCHASEFLKAHGATNVLAVATHPVFSASAPERLAAAPIDRVIVTNTLPIAAAKRERLGDKLIEISVASLLGEAIRRIHQGISVGAMYQHV